jgi:hypothetical protein
LAESLQNIRGEIEQKYEKPLTKSNEYIIIRYKKRKTPAGRGDRFRLMGQPIRYAEARHKKRRL